MAATQPPDGGGGDGNGEISGEGGINPDKVRVIIINNRDKRD